MKTIFYILLVIFIVAYSLTTLFGLGAYLFSGFGGSNSYFWLIPVYLILSTTLFFAYVASLRKEVYNSNPNKLVF